MREWIRSRSQLQLRLTQNRLVCAGVFVFSQTMGDLVKSHPLLILYQIVRVYLLVEDRGKESLIFKIKKSSRSSQFAFCILENVSCCAIAGNLLESTIARYSVRPLESSH